MKTLPKLTEKRREQVRTAQQKWRERKKQRDQEKDRRIKDLENEVRELRARKPANPPLNQVQESLMHGLSIARLEDVDNALDAHAANDPVLRSLLDRRDALVSEIIEDSTGLF